MSEDLPIKVCKLCGLEKHLDSFYKNRKGVHSICKPCFVEKNKEYQAKYRANNRFAIRMRSCRARATDKGLNFDLTADYIEGIWTGFCPVFGTELFIKAKRGEAGHAQLDRINPERGYVKGNVEWLSERANRIKDDATIEDLERILKWLKSK